MIQAERRIWFSNLENAWTALRRIRETIEARVPPGALLSEDAVLEKYGAEPVHEAEAICEALVRMFGERSSG